MLRDRYDMDFPGYRLLSDILPPGYERKQREDRVVFEGRSDHFNIVYKRETVEETTREEIRIGEGIEQDVLLLEAQSDRGQLFTDPNSIDYRASHNFDYSGGPPDPIDDTAPLLRAYELKGLIMKSLLPKSSF